MCWLLVGSKRCFQRGEVELRREVPNPWRRELGQLGKLAGCAGMSHLPHPQKIEKSERTLVGNRAVIFTQASRFRGFGDRVVQVANPVDQTILQCLVGSEDPSVGTFSCVRHVGLLVVRKYLPLFDVVDELAFQFGASFLNDGEELRKGVIDHVLPQLTLLGLHGLEG